MSATNEKATIPTVAYPKNTAVILIDPVENGDLNVVRCGATENEWDHLDLALGLSTDLLPTVANLKATISATSGLKGLGKVPTRYNATRHVSGFAKWPEHRANDAEVAQWRDEPDYGACVITREVRGLDVDITDPVLALKVQAFIAAHLGYALPKRFRANSSKFLHPFKLVGDFGKRVIQVGEKNQIEFLMTGQQFVAAGTHPSGARIEWEGGMPCEIPELNEAQFEALFTALQDEFGIVGATITASPIDRPTGEDSKTIDPCVAYLEEEGLVLGKRKGKLIVACPWAHEHTDDTTGTDSTVYIPGGTNGAPDPGFCCKHGHCTGRNFKHYQEAIGYDGGVDDFEMVEPEAASKGDKKPFSLDDFALNGSSQEMRKKMLDDVFIVGRLAILGQATVFYAQPNTGKTLITIWMLIDAIKLGDLKAADVFYVNADDTHKGIVTKLELAEQYGFKLLSPGHNGFSADKLVGYMAKLVSQGDARGKVIILDTLKKFTDIMDKKVSTAFGKAMREFVSNGGSVIMLAHVNKHKTAEGKVIHSGTSDIADDVDCAYTLEKVKDDNDTHTVIFENFKNRGDVAANATYSYTRREGQDYLELLDTVQSLSEDDMKRAKAMKAAQTRLDANASVIWAIIDALNDGVCLKTDILETARKNCGESLKRVSKVLDEHTGENFAGGDRWKLSIGDKNAKHYSILNFA